MFDPRRPLDACRPTLALVLVSCLLTPRARAEAPPAEALVGATVIVAPGEEIADATVILRDGRIEAVGVGLVPPADALVRDMSGMVLWPGFIDAHVKAARLAKGADSSADSAPPAGHENPKARPDRRLLDSLRLEPKQVSGFREAGITTAAVVPDSGVLRGRGCVLTLGDGPLGELLVVEDPWIQASFEAGGWGTDGYPSSAMGATALLRQSLSDAAWYREAWAWSKRHSRAPQPERNVALEALGELWPAGSRKPSAGLSFDCGGVLDALRAAQVCAEFGLPLRLLGHGDEYRRLKELQEIKAPLVVPLDFPAGPTATDDEEWIDVSLGALRRWDRAPHNARWLDEAGLAVSLTTEGLESPGTLSARVRRMIEGGLPEETALAMFTTHPAEMLGLSSRLGAIRPGMSADLVAAHGRPFEDGTEIRSVWTAGRRHVISRPPTGAVGKWEATLTMDGRERRAVLHLKRAGGSAKWLDEDDESDSKTSKLKDVEYPRGGVAFSIDGKSLGGTGDLRVIASVEGPRLSSASGSPGLVATRLLGPEPGEDSKESKSPPVAPTLDGGPLSSADSFLVKGATVWTCATPPSVERMDVLVKDGRIAAVGQDLSAHSSVEVIEGEGRHLTPGLIDAHSHAAIVGGVNEGTNSCTAEVRIGDVVNSETRALYLQLAGGLTSANLLHGSANCMGGQSQVIKLRHGAPPEELKFAEATPAIKFALGENVKQSNWGEKYTTRFPQTRMGVEQFMRQKFAEAADYRTAMADWKARRGRATKLPPRRDLQLEALVEILEGERKIHCHSYRQDEILMLMRVAEEFGFRVGTFQHVLEGYKVAEELARHGAMASTFSDWWAYKFEVYDAIPYNGALMHDRDVVVSFNSDSTELGRRMNLEAAKAVKWGKVPPAEALQFVTLNPAKQLGVEDYVGSVEVGKTADLVLWTGPPLSTGTRAEKTWVDGRLYFDLGEDLSRREARIEERQALIAAFKSRDEDDSSGGGSREPATYLVAGEGHCLDGVGTHDHEIAAGGVR